MTEQPSALVTVTIQDQSGAGTITLAGAGASTTLRDQIRTRMPQLVGG